LLLNKVSKPIPKPMQPANTGRRINDVVRPGGPTPTATAKQPVPKKSNVHPPQPKPRKLVQL
jgi:hypothetical protein